MQFGLFVKQLHCEPGIDGQQVGIVPNSHSTVPLRYRCLAKGFDKFSKLHKTQFQLSELWNKMHISLFEWQVLPFLKSKICTYFTVHFCRIVETNKKIRGKKIGGKNSRGKNSRGKKSRGKKIRGKKSRGKKFLGKKAVSRFFLSAGRLFRLCVASKLARK